MAKWQLQALGRVPELFGQEAGRKKSPGHPLARGECSKGGQKKVGRHGRVISRTHDVSLPADAATLKCHLLCCTRKLFVSKRARDSSFAR